jgi:hypothetical protein
MTIQEIHHARNSRKELLTGGNPEEVYPLIPAVKDFDDSGFIETEDLSKIGEAIASKCFLYLKDFKVLFLWKDEGGSTKGKATLGKCQKPTGLLARYSGATFIIWVAADYCRLMAIKRYELEALLYHELCHTGINEKEEPITRPHDFEAFCAEVERYGAWRHDLERAAKSFRQLKLF